MVYIGIIAAVFLTDFVLKHYIDKRVRPGEKHPVLSRRIVIETYYNKGAALNLLAEKPGLMRAIHTVLLLFVCAVCYLSMRVAGRRLGKTGLALIAGGGLSNLIDRYTKGHVVDYVRFQIGPKRLQKIVFNLSDFFILIGAALVVIGNRE